MSSTIAKRVQKFEMSKTKKEELKNDDPEEQYDADTVMVFDHKGQPIYKQKSSNRTSDATDQDDKPDYQLIILVFISRLIPISAALIAFCYIIYLIANPDNWSTDPSSPDAEILRREASRGVFVSVLIAGLLNAIGAFMFYIRVRESLVVINYGFILGPVIGFMLDQSIGTDAGFKHFMTGIGFSYTFSSLIGGNFMRYIVTVFLDLFISNPLQDILKTQVKNIGVIDVLNETTNRHDGAEKHKYLRKYDRFVALNFPSILQSIVAFVTFNAYTNQTRFAWAYPALALDRELRIPPGTIMLSTAIAGILYLNFYTIMDYISVREYFDVNTKLGYVIAILGLLYGLNQTESIEAPVEGEYDKVYTKPLTNAKPYLGILFFTCFVLYGFVYPIWTRMGCCGRCKPKEAESEETDHITQDTGQKELINVTREMLEKMVREQVQKEMENINRKP